MIQNNDKHELLRHDRERDREIVSDRDRAATPRTETERAKCFRVV